VLLLPSAVRLKEAETAALKAFADTAACLDTPRGETELRTAEDALDEALRTARASDDEGTPARTSRILAALATNLRALEPLEDEQAAVRAAFARCYAEYIAKDFLSGAHCDAVFPPSRLEKFRRIVFPDTPALAAAALESPTFEAKLEGALRAACCGGVEARFAAHFALEDADDDGTVATAAAERVVRAMVAPVGDALAEGHKASVAAQLGTKGSILRYAAKDSAKHLRWTYHWVTLDSRLKARCVSQWCTPAHTLETRPAPAMFSADWLLGKGNDRVASFVKLEDFVKAHSEFFPELLTLSRKSADDLARHRRLFWATREENRTTQLAVTMFVVVVGLLDWFIMCA